VSNGNLAKVFLERGFIADPSISHDVSVFKIKNSIYMVFAIGLVFASKAVLGTPSLFAVLNLYVVTLLSIYF
jgi:hypothetical protein